jgi:hypothetical protein
MTTTTNTNDANKALVLAGIKGVFIDRDPTVLDRLGMSKTPGTGTGYFSLVPPCPFRKLSPFDSRSAATQNMIAG